MSPRDPLLDPVPMHDPLPHDRTPHARPAAVDPRLDPVRASSYRPRRSRWPGLLAAGVVGAAIGGVVLVNLMEAPPSTAPTVAQAPQPRTAPAGTPDATPSDAGTAPTAAAPDAQITAAVKAALAADPALAPQAIDVQTQDGVVTLTGPAADEPSRERATALAAAPDGVQRVDNRLVVTAKGA